MLIQKDGHVILTDFDLSFLTSSNPLPIFVAEPVSQSNSFVGIEEYIALEIITRVLHNNAIDWWALGIFLYEMLYGRTPFRGKNRLKTFANILHKDLTFPSSILASLPARRMINSLLNRDPESRLGLGTGANEIKEHPFFWGINWPLIRCMVLGLIWISLNAHWSLMENNEGNGEVREEHKWRSMEKSSDFFLHNFESRSEAFRSLVAIEKIFPTHIHMRQLNERGSGKVGFKTEQKAEKC